MSDTPRTDAADFPSDGGARIVWADFARELERELSASRMREYQHLQITIPELQRENAAQAEEIARLRTPWMN